MDNAHQEGPRTNPLWRSEFEHDACGIGALAQLNGERSHQIIDDALSVLVNLEHRGGTGLEHNTGDGAGILFQVPHRFFRREAQRLGHLLPDEGDYGVAMIFSADPTASSGETTLSAASTSAAAPSRRTATANPPWQARSSTSAR